MTYNALGGTINTLGTRTAYYKENSLVKKPEGKSGMLIEPVNGNKVVLGWYTQVENTGTEENPVYVFDEQYRWDFENDRPERVQHHPRRAGGRYPPHAHAVRALVRPADHSIRRCGRPVRDAADLDEQRRFRAAFASDHDRAENAGWSLLDYYYDAE